MDEEIILYDFCGTLVDFQTANAYVRFVVERENIRRNFVEYVRVGLNVTRLMPVINRYRHRISLNKALLLHRLKGIRYETMNSLAKAFYEERIRPHFNEVILAKLRKDVEDGKRVIIISGGYDIYLKFFAEEFDIKNILCSRLKFKSDKFTGTIEGNDCMGNEKVLKLKEYYQSAMGAERKPSLTLYSDSETDTPLFKECEKRIVILDSKETPIWAQNIATEIIHL